MDDGFVYIDGDLEETDRRRLLRLIRRVEAAGTFRPETTAFGPAWIIVVGWQSGDTQPVSISRLRVGLTFVGVDAKRAARQMERWLEEHEAGEPEADACEGTTSA